MALKSFWRPYRARPGEKVLTLRTGNAFPPGHPTTRLCLELLGETPLAGKRLLDVGCGSGILALAGAAWGAERCVGVDLYRAAALQSRENARRNHLDGAFLVVQGSSECLRPSFQVVVANLPAAAQLTQVEEFVRLAAPGAALILSGFRDTQEEDLRQLYGQAGWSLKRRLTRDEWCIELPPEKSYTWVAWLLER
ncbi:MAG: 50S ribosomal protein L11 methyltransferase [Thermodesulfobacteriota bacterium]